MSCPPLEMLVAWFLRETSEVDERRVEDHFFDCDRCAVRAERLEAMVRSLRTVTPPLLTVARRDRIEKTTKPLPKVTVEPGETATIEFRKGTEIGFWLMKSDLEGVERVDCELLALDGAPLISFPDVPFDAERREVVLACQVHFTGFGFPNDMKARLTSFEAGGGRRVAEYGLVHKFSLDEP